MTPEISDLRLAEDDSIKSALVKIDKGALGVAFVVSNEEKLVGTITDGDVRRALLDGKTLDSSVGFIMQKAFVSLSIHSSDSDILAKLSQKIRVIPLTSDDGRLEDYATFGKLRRIPLASPNLEGNELAYVTDCIKSNWISSQGKYVKEFEQRFGELHNGYYPLAVSNGTVALHLALETIGVGKGDEVIVPDLTFAATINAVLYTGATPVIVDVDRESWNMVPEEVEKAITNNTKAILPVHLYGLPCEMSKLLDISEKNGIHLIEDCAEALGSKYNDQTVGTFGRASTFSFFGNKTITTGEGGMVLFRDEKDYERARRLRDHGMNPKKRYWHDEVGFNYRMTNLQAAIGLAQLERLDMFISKKIALAKQYTEALAELEQIQLPVELSGSKNTFWLFTIVLSGGMEKRDEALRYFTANGIEARPIFYPLHVMPPYEKYGIGKRYPNSNFISNNGISLPTHTFMDEETVAYICQTVKRFIKK